MPGRGVSRPRDHPVRPPVTSRRNRRAVDWSDCGRAQVVVWMGLHRRAHPSCEGTPVMNREQILGTPSIPIVGPTYPFGPFHFVGREYFVVLYESDPAAIRAALPEPLEPAGENLVGFEWLRTPDASRFGAYTMARGRDPRTTQG